MYFSCSAGNNFILCVSQQFYRPVPLRPSADDGQLISVRIGVLTVCRSRQVKLFYVFLLLVSHYRMKYFD